MARMRDPNRPKRVPKGDHKEGYCRPPKNKQIKPGEVRNPWGPKGKPKPSKPDPFETAVAIKVATTILGETVMTSAETAAWIQNVSAALNGDRHAFKIMVEERRSRRPLPLPEDEDPAVLAKKKALSAKLVQLLDREAARKKRAPEPD